MTSAVCEMNFPIYSSGIAVCFSTTGYNEIRFHCLGLHNETGNMFWHGGSVTNRCFIIICLKNGLEYRG